MSAFIGNQLSITEKFQKLLNFADRMFTLVLVVGDDELYKKVSDLIDFKPQDSSINPPIVKHIPVELAQKLKSNEWALNAQLIDKKVHTCISDEKSFVFYRHGSYSNLHESADEAVAEICKIFRDEYLLVVGDDNRIEINIQIDIQIVAYLAGLRNEDFQILCKNLQQSSDHCFVGTIARFTLLVLPDVDHLKKELKEKLQHPYRTLTVIYSGHGYSDGSWALYDDSFCASDLLEVLKSIPPVQHDFRLLVYLNCCYGLTFAKKISNTDLLFSAFGVKFDDIKGSKNFPAKLKDWSQKRIIKYAENPCSDGDSKCHKSINDCITYQIIKMWELAGYSIMKLNVNDKKFLGSIVPFAFGPLDAKGVLHELANKEYPCTVPIEITRADPKPLDCRLSGIGVDPEPADPQLIVFPGGRGDSTLFRWHNFNMLVDGGHMHSSTRRSKSPCFWETVRRLPGNQKLDIVVVTHYDEDHIAGILRLFEEENGLPIGIGKLYTVTPFDRNTPTTRSERQGIELVDLAERSKRSNHLEDVLNLNTDCVKPICSSQFSEDILCIYMVTPTEENLQKARDNITRESAANRGSASLLIKCYIASSQQHRYALLTGDAPAQAIINGLDTLRANQGILGVNAYQNDHYSFDYVDMPHHGACTKDHPDSLDDNPRLFLSRIHTKACLVSTNGKLYGHPQDKSLEFFKNSLEYRTIKMLFFTHCKRNKVDIRPKLAPQLDYCVFANNDPSNESQPTKCFLFNLHTLKYQECETRDVCYRDDDSTALLTS